MEGGSRDIGRQRDASSPAADLTGIDAKSSQGEVGAPAHLFVLIVESRSRGAHDTLIVREPGEGHRPCVADMR